MPFKMHKVIFFPEKENMCAYHTLNFQICYPNTLIFYLAQGVRLSGLVDKFITLLIVLFQKDEIENCRVNGSLQFLVLKKLNRLAHIRCKKVRDETNEVRINLKLYSIIQHKVQSSQ